MKLKHTPVIFKDAAGNLITNDPVLRAHQTLGEDISEYLTEAPTSAGVGDVSRTNDDEEIDTDPYNELGGKELKKLAADRGVNIRGLKTVGEVRQALRDADEAEDESDDDEDDESDNGENPPADKA